MANKKQIRSGAKTVLKMLKNKPTPQQARSLINLMAKPYKKTKGSKYA